MKKSPLFLIPVLVMAFSLVACHDNDDDGVNEENLSLQNINKTKNTGEEELLIGNQDVNESEDNEHNNDNESEVNNDHGDNNANDENNDNGLNDNGQNNGNESADIESNDNNDNVDNETNVELGIKELSGQIIDALDKRDISFVSQYVHSEKGLLFSPYVNVKDESVVFEKEAVSSMLDSDEILDWGSYDGKGTPIELTSSEYFAEFLDMAPYEDVDEILVNDLQDRGNTINNVREVFPSAKIIEYYHEGSDEYAGTDWSSVIFVYEYDETLGLQLIAIVRDMWTI